MSQTEIICQALDARKKQESPSLFSDKKSTYYWTMSDLSCLYPDLFSMQNLVRYRTIKKMNNSIKDCIPEFQDITPEPIHILNTKEDYVLTNQENKPTTIKKGSNQRLTRIACEFLFSQIPNTEIQQAYFMSPDKSYEEIQNLSEEIKFANVRHQVTKSCNALSAIAIRAQCATRHSFNKIWSLFWCVLYNVPNMNILRTEYNIKTTPLDYMLPNTLSFINYKLQQIIEDLRTNKYYDIQTVKHKIRQAAIESRHRFYQYKTTPEAKLTLKNSRNRISKVKKIRKKFWQTYYPESLNIR